LRRPSADAFCEAALSAGADVLAEHETDGRESLYVWLTRATRIEREPVAGREATQRAAAAAARRHLRAMLARVVDRTHALIERPPRRIVENVAKGPLVDVAERRSLVDEADTRVDAAVRQQIDVVAALEKAQTATATAIFDL